MGKLIPFLTCITAATALAVSSGASICISGPVSDNGRDCTVECGVDHPGGDYSAQYVADFQTCIDVCTADPACATAQYSYSTSYCYLKNTVDPSSNNANVNSVVCQAPTTAPPPTPDTCTAGSVTLNGRSGALQCGFDYPGGDYASQYTGSLVACENLCAADLKCLTAQYNKDTKYCYLKSYVQPSTLNSEINSIIFSSTVTKPGCMPYAPVSPYMQSPGFEQGFQGWTSYPHAGDFNESVTTNIALEGCNAYVVTPSKSNLLSRSASYGVSFQGLQVGKTYTISVKVGTPNSTALLSGPAPTIHVDIQGTISTTIIRNTPICGYTTTGACPIQGVGGASGQVISGQFLTTTSSSTAAFYLNWVGGTANNDAVLLDDVEIALL